MPCSRVTKIVEHLSNILLMIATPEWTQKHYNYARACRPGSFQGYIVGNVLDKGIIVRYFSFFERKQFLKAVRFFCRLRTLLRFSRISSNSFSIILNSAVIVVNSAIRTSLNKHVSWVRYVIIYASIEMLLDGLQRHSLHQSSFLSHFSRKLILRI